MGVRRAGPVVLEFRVDEMDGRIRRRGDEEFELAAAR